MKEQILHSLKKLMLILAKHPGYLVARKINRTCQKLRVTKLRVLDAGAGQGGPWAVANLFIQENLSLEIVCLDAVSGTEHAGKLRQNNHITPITEDLHKWIPNRLDDEFHLVFFLDVLEHMSAESGYQVLYAANRISSNGVAVTTPNGFLYQPPSRENPFQAHISGWGPNKLRAAGFSKVIGLHGLRALSGPYGAKKYPLNKISYPLYALETILGRALPRLSAQLWAENSADPVDGVEPLNLTNTLLNEKT